LFRQNLKVQIFSHFFSKKASLGGKKILIFNAKIKKNLIDDLGYLNKNSASKRPFAHEIFELL